MADLYEQELAQLKVHLGITPKTTKMLHAAGFTHPRLLADISPNQLVAAFAKLPGMTLKTAKYYSRAARRMVMLGAVDDAQEAALVVGNCKNWSNKELTRLGVYEEQFDDLTGIEIRERLDPALTFI